MSDEQQPEAPEAGGEAGPEPAPEPAGQVPRRVRRAWARQSTGAGACSGSGAGAQVQAPVHLTPAQTRRVRQISRQNRFEQLAVACSMDVWVRRP